MKNPDRNGYAWAIGFIDRPKKVTPQRKKQWRRPWGELLESRCLLTTITEFGPLNISGGHSSEPISVVVGSDSNIWFTELDGSQVGMINTTAPSNTPTTFSQGVSAGSNPEGIVSGPDGAIWFSQSSITANAIGMINPTLPNTQSIPSFGTANGMTANSGPGSMAVAGGDIWFMQPLSDQIGKLDPSTTPVTITEYSAPAGLLHFESAIVLGPDGNLWFTEPGKIDIYSQSGTPAGSVTLPTAPDGTVQTPFGITVGPDGNIWFTESVLTGTSSSAGVGVVDLRNNDHVTEFATGTTAEPFGITSGPDGNIWFTEAGAGAIGTVIVNSTDPSTDTLGTSITIPTTVVASPSPQGITAGPDGNLWFADGSARSAGLTRTFSHTLW